MEPFSKDDPLYHLLGKARPVNPRPNFTQNVMRTVRNTPQQPPNWLASLTTTLKLHTTTTRTLLITTPTLAILLATALLLNLHHHTPPTPTPTLAQYTNTPTPTHTNTIPPASTTESLVASELDSMDQLSDLLSSQDTSSLTDGELAMLLY